MVRAMASTHRNRVAADHTSVPTSSLNNRKLLVMIAASNNSGSFSDFRYTIPIVNGICSRHKPYERQLLCCGGLLRSRWAGLFRALIQWFFRTYARIFTPHASGFSRYAHSGAYNVGRECHHDISLRSHHIFYRWKIDYFS